MEVFRLNYKHVEYSKVKTYVPYHSPFDPCPPIGKKYFCTPPNLYVGYQPPNLEQYHPFEALKKGTLWPVFYDEYQNPYKRGGK